MAQTKRSPRDPERESASLTVAEVARLDTCSEKTVRRAIAAGLLEAMRIGPGGRLVRISRAAHEAYRRAGRA